VSGTEALHPDEVIFDARLQGKRQDKNTHVEEDEWGEVQVFIFRQPPPQDLHCVICWELFRDPVIDPCGHSFCRQCIETEVGSSGRCPISRRGLVVEQLGPNLLAKSMVDELEVHCTYGCKFTDDGRWVVDEEEGCPDTVKFGLRRAHVRACEYATVKCPAGGDRCDRIPRIDLDFHLEDDCEYSKQKKRKDRFRASEVDMTEVVTYLLIWSLIMFGIFTSESLGPLAWQASGPLTVLLSIPATLMVVVIIVEYFINRPGDVDDDSDEDDY